MKGKILGLVALLAFSGATWSHGESQHKPSGKKQVKVSEETAFGRAGDTKKSVRTINVGMDDSMHFTPADITIKPGDTVRFVVRNNGKIMHEMVIGTLKELKAHGELMKKFPGMEHDEDYMTHVAPGKQEQIVWQFTKPGEFHYAYLIPGHLEAGMIAKIIVKWSMTFHSIRKKFG